MGNKDRDEDGRDVEDVHTCRRRGTIARESMSPSSIQFNPIQVN